jgi:hypothetical protein
MREDLGKIAPLELITVKALNDRRGTGRVAEPLLAQKPVRRRLGRRAFRDER